MDFLQNLIALPGPETVQNVFFPGLGTHDVYGTFQIFFLNAFCRRA